MNLSEAEKGLIIFVAMSVLVVLTYSALTIISMVPAPPKEQNSWFQLLSVPEEENEGQ